MTRKNARMQRSPLVEPNGAPANQARIREDTGAREARAREIGEQEIRALAHQIFESRCREGTPGDERSDWLEAERQLRR